MSNITALKPANPMPADFPDALRALADRVQAGEVTGFVAAYWCADEMTFLWPSSLSDSLVLAAVLQQQAIDRYRV